MKVTTIGVGGAWAPAGTWNALAVVQPDDPSDKKLLIDCGGDVRHALADSNISPDSIGAIWITHMHGDHIDGLEYFAFNRYCRKEPKPTLFIHEKMLEPLWKALEPKIGQFQDFQSMRLCDYFDIALVHDDSSIIWNGYILDPITFPHINTVNNKKLGNSIGVMIVDTRTGRAALFTGDTRAVLNKAHTPEANKLLNVDDIQAAYEDAHMIFQDFTILHNSIVHASLDDLTKYPAEIKKKMVLTHCTPSLTLQQTLLAEGFIGQATAGATYNVKHSN